MSELHEKLKQFEQELQNVPPEKQQEKLNELLSTLTPEELDELKKQQCVICGIVSGKVPAIVIYEDEDVMIVPDINPASPGHVIIFPKAHYPLLAMVPNEIVSKLFVVANNVAKALFEGMQAEGTNIYVANGPAAGQMLPHVVVNVIPRYKEDGIKFEWTFGKMETEELQKIAEKIKSKFEVPKLAVQQEAEEEPEPEEEEEEIEEDEPRKIP